MSATSNGSGHAFLLRHCLGGVPGWRINDYLPNWNGRAVAVGFKGG
jgi:hypothetical protein